jgi:hypothetical protein
MHYTWVLALELVERICNLLARSARGGHGRKLVNRRRPRNQLKLLTTLSKYSGKNVPFPALDVI